MGYNFKDYINESTKYMYDDNYITEAKNIHQRKQPRPI